MNKFHLKILLKYALVLLVFVCACQKNFLDKPPLGSLTSAQLANKTGVDGLLIGAYALLDGVSSANPFEYSDYGAAAPSNWIYGSVASDDSHTGSTSGDLTEIERIEAYNPLATQQLFSVRWQTVYSGVQKANDVLRELKLVTDGSITPEYAIELTAEARFLRGIYHFEAVKVWKNVPYVDETVTYENGNYLIPNNTDIYPQIEADFSYAADNLLETQEQVGRVNSWAAKSFLAKVYLYQHKYSDALTLLTDIINNGKTSGGLKYDLVHYADNFNPSTKNSAESIFAVQSTVQDGSGGYNGDVGDILTYPLGGPATCCGFNAPSFSLVNSFKTDANGLPLLDTWNDADVKNDQGILSSQPFTPYTGNLDPRLDWTVGRRGIPYLDWGIFPGADWIRQQSNSGPYIGKKNIFYKAAAANTSDLYGGWAPASSNNVNMIRFGDVILMAAECEVEAGSLAKAEEYVNMIRNRAADPTGWVDTDAAHYVVAPYTGQFAANGQDYARKAVRFERKLELAMEGQRFFDLQRWDNGSGEMASVLNAYIYHETHIPGFDYKILNGAKFTQNKNELFPIPQDQIDLSKSTLKQNQGY